MVTSFEGLTTTQVARRLGISPQRVVQLANAGRLPCHWTPHGRLFDREAVERLAVARERTRLEGTAGGGR